MINEGIVYLCIISAILPWHITWNRFSGAKLLESLLFIKTIRPEKLSDHRKIPQCSYNFERIGIGWCVQQLSVVTSMWNTQKQRKRTSWEDHCRQSLAWQRQSWNCPSLSLQSFDTYSSIKTQMEEKWPVWNQVKKVQLIRYTFDE